MYVHVLFFTLYKEDSYYVFIDAHQAMMMMQGYLIRYEPYNSIQSYK